ncbi:hypothetical protein, partial [Acinetobacter sp.]|uniref:hypothetical protein n=1 Tax=Acinetobacter sp. TaxID=472 RepID=UPI0025C034D1
PATATVYVDKSPTRVDHYVTDNEGNPTLVYGASAGTTWGNISGNIDLQLDLKTVLDTKYNVSNPNGYQTAAQVSTAITSGLTGYATQSWVTSQGYLTSEADPVFAASPAAGITNPNISNWNTAYGWGNHASAGYLTSINSGLVTAALGYTPYNSTNPNNYQTGAQVSTALTSALTGYATESWVSSQGYQTEEEIIGLILCLG